MTVKAGIVGPGRSANGYGIGHYVTREVLNFQDSDLIAVLGNTKSSIDFAMDEINADSLVKRKFTGLKYSAENKNDFFTIKGLDLVIICSPAETHQDYINLALQNKKHILVEKPLIKDANKAFSSRVQTARELIHLASDNGLFLSTNCQRSAVIPFLKEKKAIPEMVTNVDIKFVTGTKNEPLADAEKLFDLLIAHPISILVKLGASDKSQLMIKQSRQQHDSRGISLNISGTYGGRHEPTSFNMTIAQIKEQITASMELAINDIAPIRIDTVILSGGIQTICEIRSYPPKSYYMEDTLKYCVNSFIKAAGDPSKLLMPLITNRESYSIYAIQETMRDRLKDWK